MIGLLTVATTAGLAATQGGVTEQTTPSNNTTIQHERPSDVSESGDAQQVSQWLENRLASQLGGSAINISQGQYDQARGILGDEYNSRLDQYVSVAGDTEGDSSDNRAAERFQTAQDNQRSYANTTQEYRDTYTTYEQARQEGNTTAARQAARELETLSEQVQQLNTSLQGDYETISNQTGVNTTQTQALVAQTTTDIAIQQAEVRAQTFIETRLTVQVNDSATAFDNPLVLSGEVTTANGTAVQNESARILVSDRTYRVTTNREGRFTVTYRPVSLPVNTTAVRVRFRPESTSAYLGSATNVPVNVTQASPNIELLATQTTGAYGERLTTTAIVTIDGRPVPRLPISAQLGGSTVSARTGSSGRVTLSPRVSAELTPGEQLLRVSHSRTNVAIGPNATTQPVNITKSETSLTVNAANDDVLYINGRLRTSEGVAISGQSIQLTIGGTNRSVTTNTTGWYQFTTANFSAIERQDNSTTVIVARFVGTNTNLEDSQAQTTVSLRRAANSDDSSTSTSTALVFGGAITGLLILIAAVAWSRREQTDHSSTDPEPTDNDSSASTDSSETSQQWLDRAQGALQATNHDQAIITAYAAVRSQFESTDQAPQTHREFLAACEPDLSPANRESLSKVATAYEYAVFRGDVEDGTAAEAVEAAVDLLSRTNDTGQ